MVTGKTMWGSHMYSGEGFTLILERSPVPVQPVVILASDASINWITVRAIADKMDQHYSQGGSRRVRWAIAHVLAGAPFCCSSSFAGLRILISLYATAERWLPTILRTTISRFRQRTSSTTLFLLPLFSLNVWQCMAVFLPGVISNGNGRSKSSATNWSTSWRFD